AEALLEVHGEGSIGHPDAPRHTGLTDRPPEALSRPLMGTLQLVRHGQASAFEENYDRLSSLGERQARLLGEAWSRRGVRFDRVFTGPRMRQRRTAEIAAEIARLPAPVVLDELDEMQVEPLFQEAMPEVFSRHAHIQALGDAMLAADGDEARARSFARLFEAVLRLWLQGQ